MISIEHREGGAQVVLVSSQNLAKIAREVLKRLHTKLIKGHGPRSHKLIERHIQKESSLETILEIGGSLFSLFASLRKGPHFLMVVTNDAFVLPMGLLPDFTHDYQLNDGRRYGYPF